MRSPKCFLTNVTIVGFNSRVCCRMRHQISFRSKHLPTLHTLVGTIMLQHMIIQIFFRQQSFVANRTVKFVLVQMSHLPMLIEGVITPIKSAADITHVLRNSMGSNMEFQVPFHLESFSAMFTSKLVLGCVLSNIMRLEIVFRLCSVFTFVTVMQQTCIHVLVNLTVSFQVTFVLESFRTSGTFERPMKTVLATDMTQNLAFLFKGHLTNIASIITVV